MLAIGRNPVIELLRSNKKVDKLYLESGITQDEKIGEALQLAQQKNIKLEMVPRKDLENLADGEPHQGILAEASFQVENITSNDIIDRSGFYLYIREAQYEHNLGAIARTAEVANIAGIVIPPKQEVTSTAARISMGAMFHLPVYYGSLFPTIKLFKNMGYFISGLERGGNYIFEAELNENTLLIVGGEDKSISQPVIDKCDQLVSIPQHGKVNSLNMSVAAGIAIYEYRRQNPFTE